MPGNKLIVVLVDLESYDGIENAVHSYALYKRIHTFIVFHLERVIGKILDVAYGDDANFFSFEIVFSFVHRLPPSLSSFSYIAFASPQP